MRRVEEWYRVSDGDDIAPAWARMMAGEPATDGGAPIRLPDPTRPIEWPGSDEWGCRVAFGPGDYHFRSGGMEWTRRVLLSGEGVINTRLYFHGGGVRFCARGSEGSTRPGQSASGAVMADLSIIGKPATPRDGVLIEAPVSLERVRVTDFELDGVRIDADVNRPHPTNANLCQLHNVHSDGNGRDGFFLRGGDANSCVFVGCSAAGNGRHGIRDESFLGSAVWGFHAAHNGDTSNPEHGDYRATGASQRGAWLGLYEEAPDTAAGDVRRSRIHAPNRWEGRVLVDAQNAETASAGIRMSTNGMLLSTTHFQRPNGRVAMTLAPPDVDGVWQISDALDPQDWHVRKKGRAGGFSGLWYDAPKAGNAGVPFAYKAGEMRAPSAMLAAPKAAATDLPPLRVVETLPAAVTVGATVLVRSVNGARLYLGESTPSGDVWTPVQWSQP